MRCLVPARAFRRRLAAVAAAIPRHCSKPLLETVRLEIDERGRGTICATDLETWVRVRAPILHVIRSGAAQLPAAALATLLGEAANGDVELDADPEAFGLTCGAVDRTCPLIVTGAGSARPSPCTVRRIIRSARSRQARGVTCWSAGIWRT